MMKRTTLVGLVLALHAPLVLSSEPSSAETGAEVQETEPAAQAPADRWASAVDSPAPAVDGAAPAADGAAAAPEGAAPTADSGRARRAHPDDPFESVNRVVFVFNGVIDRVLVEPVAVAYETVVPSPIRRGVGNFFGNLGDAWSAVNLVLQAKPAKALEMTARFGLNTVFGLLGTVDVATDAGFERQSEDLGQTLAHWGVPAGGYVVLPIFGSSTLRDAVALPLDRAAIGLAQPSGEPQRWRWLGTQVTNARAEALPFTRMLDTIALDKYTFVRDAYLTRRRSQVYDGNPPPEPESD